MCPGPSERGIASAEDITASARTRRCPTTSSRGDAVAHVGRERGQACDECRVLACPLRRGVPRLFRCEATACLKEVPRLMCLGLCNAGASTLHNSLGGAGCGGNNCEDMVSTVPAWTGTANENACQGKMLNDPCMPSMGALAPPLPKGAARLTVHLIARAQSLRTFSAVMIPTLFRGSST